MIRERQDGAIEVDGEELRLVRKILESFASAVTTRLVAQGISRRLLVRTYQAAAQDLFGPAAQAIDARALLGEGETEPPAPTA